MLPRLFPHTWKVCEWNPQQAIIDGLSVCARVHTHPCFLGSLTSGQIMPIGRVELQTSLIVNLVTEGLNVE